MIRFAEYEDCLPNDLQEQVLRHITNQASRFKETGVPGVRILPSLAEGSALIGGRIRKFMPQACERLGLAVPSTALVCHPVAALEDGGKLDVAALADSEHVSGVTYILTLFELRRRFTGGVLRLEDPEDRDVRLTLPPVSGRIVFCPECYDVEISRVRNRSHDFESCLFVMLATTRIG